MVPEQVQYYLQLAHMQQVVQTLIFFFFFVFIIPFVVSSSVSSL